MSKKIVLIGAGSVRFTQGLLADLIRTFDGEKWQLALVDIDPKALDTVSKICRKMIEFKKSDLQLACSTDRCDVLPGTDYVITTIGVGGRRAWEKDVFIPRKYGIFQPVGDSVMPGGISRAMRMIPAMIDIIKDVEKLCPKAQVFNYSNPMTMICRGIRKSTGFPVIGLCHGVAETEDYLAEFVGFERSKVTSYAVGLNHLTFMFDFRYDGKDAFPLFREKHAQIKKEGIDYTNAGRGYGEMDKEAPPLEELFAWELFEIYNAFPAPGDRHITEYFAERFVKQGSYYGKTLGVDAFSFEQTIESGDKEYSRMECIAESSNDSHDSFSGYFSGEQEQIMNIIHSIEHDKRKVFYANIPNNGIVTKLPNDVVLEMPAAATAIGLLPLQVRNFPDTLTAIIGKHAAVAEIAVEAALKGDKNLFVEAIMTGGYVTDKKIVINMVDEMLQAHSQYLPQF